MMIPMASNNFGYILFRAPVVWYACVIVLYSVCFQLHGGTSGFTGACDTRMPQLQSFKSDFQHLHDLKSFVLKELEDFRNGKLDFDVDSYNPTKGQNREFADGRKVRTLFTQGHKYTADILLVYFLQSVSPTKKLKSSGITQGYHGYEATPCSVSNTDKPKQLTFVGFFGTQRQKSEMPQLVRDMMWSMDSYLGEELQKFPSLLAQCYAEVSPGGDWYNLVLLLNEESMHHWRNSSIHRFAVSDIAPRYYASVRIHRGQLPAGLYSDKFHVQRTLFVNYAKSKDDSANVTRDIRHWRPEDLPSEECHVTC